MMQEHFHHYSQSASRIRLSCRSPIFKINPAKHSPKISPDVSPSCYAIHNHPFDNNKFTFFNSDLSLSELKKLGGIASIEEETEEQISDSKVILQVTSMSAKKTSFLKNGQDAQACLEISKNELRFVPINVVPVFLQKPPVRSGYVKREKRCVYDNEMISYDRYKGELKFYNFKKRNGFIKVEEEDFDAFICEDDLILSGLNLKKFKDDVYKKKTMRFEFNIKKYLNANGEEKRKAVQIRLADIT